MIFYFTATGNSLYVAKELGAALGDGDLRSIPQELRREGDLRYEADSIGIVCPTFTGLMPRIVRRFLKRAAFDAPYLYVVMTYGMNPSVAEEEAVAYGEHVGVCVDFAATVQMVDNWLFAFDMDEQAAMDKHVPEQLEELKAAVSERRRGHREPTEQQRQAFAMGSERNCRWPEMTDGTQVTVIPVRCIGCGTCAKVCPLGRFYVGEDGKAHRVSEYCELCLACAHACPKKAITLSVQDKNPDARYRNPEVKLAEIIKANNVTA